MRWSKSNRQVAGTAANVLSVFGVRFAVWAQPGTPTVILSATQSASLTVSLGMAGPSRPAGPQGVAKPVEPQGLASPAGTQGPTGSLGPCGDSATKPRASDGTLPGAFVVGDNQQGVAFDGADIRITSTVANGPRAVHFDGVHIGVANSLSNSVTNLRGSDGAFLGTFTLGNGRPGLVFGGAGIRAAIQIGNHVVALRNGDGTVVGTFGAGTPVGMVFDLDNIWLPNTNSSQHFKNVKTCAHV
jgi:hypothetical protein